MKELRSLPEDEQDRAAEALFAFARERADWPRLTDIGCRVAHGYWKVRGPSGAGVSEGAAFVTASGGRRRDEELAQPKKASVREEQRPQGSSTRGPR